MKACPCCTRNKLTLFWLYRHLSARHKFPADLAFTAAVAVHYGKEIAWHRRKDGQVDGVMVQLPILL